MGGVLPSRRAMTAHPGVQSSSRAPRRRLLATVALVAAGGACALTGGPSGTDGAADDPLLRPYSEVREAATARSRRGVVAAGSRGAALAGVRVLEEGGNAVDAAVTAAFALGATDPGGSGIGGATSILIRTPDGRAVAFDGSPPAPLAVRPEVLAGLAARDELFGHPTVAVPTTVAVLAAALKRHGTFTFDRVVAPSVTLAARGYAMGFTERAFLGDYLGKIARSPLLSRDRIHGGRPLPLGTRVEQPELARTLRLLARRGSDEFYRGAVASAIEHDMRRRGGFVGRADLALVRATATEPVRGLYRGREVLSLGRPSGGTAVIIALQVLDRFPPARLASPSVERLELLADAVRIAQADADRVRHDALSGGRALEQRLLSPAHAAARARLAAQPGRVPDAALAGLGRRSHGDGNTTQVSVIDSDGTVVSLTQSLGRYFGAAVGHPELGFPYNCLLEAFELEDPSHPRYLRPRATAPSTTAPTIVLGPEGEPEAALGSAGSERITSAVVDVLVALVDGKLPLPAAVSAPRVLWTGEHDGRIAFEIVPPLTDEAAAALEARGWAGVYALRFPARTIDLVYFGGVNAVAREADGTLVAAADPRRDGAAAAVR